MILMGYAEYWCDLDWGLRLPFALASAPAKHEKSRLSIDSDGLRALERWSERFAVSLLEILSYVIVFPRRTISIRREFLSPKGSEGLGEKTCTRAAHSACANPTNQGQTRSSR